MHERTDSQLLRAYAEGRSEEAFTELVRRHIDLVHSAALRMVRDASLAKDVTQGTFLALANNARKLADRLVLAGWLHRTAQNIAAQSVRTDMRRRAREQEAAAMNEILCEESEAQWDHISPHLDAILKELNEADRDALLLRYFEHKSAREVAQRLGTTEEAAQKRVERAIERVRALFSQRNLTIGSAGFVVLISANAVQAVPLGLTSVIAKTAFVAAATSLTSTIATTTKTIAMTTLQKALVTVTIAVLAGVGIYEARTTSGLRNEVQTLQQERQKMNEQLQSEKDNAANRIAELNRETEKPKDDSSDQQALRDDIKRLQKKNAELAEQLKDAEEFESGVFQTMSNTPLVRTFVSTVNTTASWDQAIVTGGWKTPSGKRALIFVTLTPNADQQLTIQPKILEYTEKAGEKLGLNQFNYDRKLNGLTGPKTTKINSNEAEDIFKSAETTEGAQISMSPGVSTLSGRQAKVQVGDVLQTASGEIYSTGPTIDLQPTISADSQSVKLIMTSQLNYPIPFPPNTSKP